MHQQHPVLRQEPIELRPHRQERRGLDLDQEIVTPDVDHEAVERHLEDVARLRVLGLEIKLLFWSQVLVERSAAG